MKKTLAALLLITSLTLLGAAENTELPRLLNYEGLAAEISEHLHWCMPDDVLSGPEDSIYIAPTAEDIQSLLKFYRWRREGMEYLPEGWDCDNFSREFKHWSDVWGVRYYSHTHAAVAVGMAYVKVDGYIEDIFPRSQGSWVSGYHVLNVILRADGQFLFFEPQTGALVPVESMLYEGSLEVLKINL
jgi:hypothetical protein